MFESKLDKYSEVNSPNMASKKLRDPIFAFLYIGNLIGIAIVCAMYAPNIDFSEIEVNDDATTDNTAPYIVVAILALILAMALSMLVIWLCLRFTSKMIIGSIILQVVVAVVAAAVSFAYGSPWPGVGFLALAALYVCYYYCIRRRIPFSTANLKTGITGMRANMGIVAFAFFLLIIQFGFYALYGVAYMGLQQTFFPCVNGVCETPNGGMVFGILLSFFWTQQVCMQVVHVTSCGAIATWWFQPERCTGCCSGAVTASIGRATTTSFGSICLGSLLSALISAIRAMAQNANNSGDGNFFTCIAVCLLQCLEAIIDYFNKWAFVYVAVYGETYVTSGKSVFNLFKNRGWSAIINDDLIAGVIRLSVLMIGLLCGGLGWLSFYVSEESFQRQENAEVSERAL